MFNKEEVREQIIQYFRAVGSGQNIVQAIKEALFLNEQFSPLTLFEMLSQGKQKITRGDWKRYLGKKNIGFSDKQIRYFFRHNHFGQEITLNEFLQAIIPHNADVVREFKSKYLESLEIEELDPQVDFIFAELMKNWIDFLRNLIEIRSQISQKVTRRQIQHLVKQDLVLYSKPREARKFHETFQQSKFDLSFHELRKFLELWVSSKEIVHEFCLLNVKRHIKHDNPFVKITHRYKKQSKNRSRSRSASRSLSASRSVSRNRDTEPKRRPISTDKKPPRTSEQPANQYPNEQQEDEYLSGQKNLKGQSGKSANGQSKYEEYRRELWGNLAKQQLKENALVQGSNSKRDYISHNQSHNSGAKPKYQNGQQSNRKQYSNHKQPFYNPFTQKQAQKSSKKEKEIQQPKNSFPKNEQKNQKQVNDPKSKFPKSEQGQVVTKMFQQIIIKQDRLEKLRKQLAKSNDFSIINLFKLVDNSNKGYISAQSLKAFTSQNVSYSGLVNNYAREKDKLRFQQFSSIFRPLSKQLNQALDSRPQHKVPNPFKRETMRLILQIIQLENQMHLNLSSLRNRVRQEGISPKSLFQYVDVNKKGYIDSQNVREMLQQSNINCEPKDLKCFMKLFHKKIEERISLKEFLSFIDF